MWDNSFLTNTAVTQVQTAILISLLIPVQSGGDDLNLRGMKLQPKQVHLRLWLDHLL